MSEYRGRRNWKGAIWGVFLVLIGAAFLAERNGMVEMPPIEGLWPIVLVVIGVTHLADRRPGSAITFLLMAVVFFAAANEWWGLGYGNSWPLLIVAAGIGIVIKALSREESRSEAFVRVNLDAQERRDADREPKVKGADVANGGAS